MIRSVCQSRSNTGPGWVIRSVACCPPSVSPFRRMSNASDGNPWLSPQVSGHLSGVTGVERRKKGGKKPNAHFLSLFLFFLPSSTPPSLLCQGMVYSAEYIKKKLETEMILSQAFGRDLVGDSARRSPPWPRSPPST